MISEISSGTEGLKVIGILVLLIMSPKKASANEFQLLRRMGLMSSITTIIRITGVT